jgi:hypothetical protein
MVSLKITENDIIKVFLAILGSWRWGPYGGPDLWRNMYQVRVRVRVNLEEPRQYFPFVLP